LHSAGPHVVIFIYCDQPFEECKKTKKKDMIHFLIHQQSES
jgi:hypothetical protein